MAVALSSKDYDAVVARLRGAGCVFAEDEAALLVEAATTAEGLHALVDRRAAGEPLEPLLGWVEFGGRRVSIDAGVFVPRRRTEFLVDVAVASLTGPARVLDMCCGCGAIGLAIAEAAPGIELHAAELDPVAAACAQRNLGASPVFIGDLFTAIPDTNLGGYDVIAANVPYVPTADIAGMPPEARVHEPRVALDGGEDGLDVLRRVAGEAPQWLVPGGVVLIETSDGQASAASDAFRSAGLITEVRRDPDVGATVVVGQRPAMPA